MSETDFISIDQNSNVLWDALPKLAALARHGLTGVHAVEDVDVAFTRQGADPAAGAALALEPERWYRTGNSDWGAALFYTAFLGRNMVNPRELEPFTGLTVAALARKLDWTLDELYLHLAGSDNLQLTGCSYAGGVDRHRVIGDLGTAECAIFVRDLLDHARRDLLERFPEPVAQHRITAWFDTEQACMERDLSAYAAAPLVRFYQAWMGRHLPADRVRVTTTSEWFAEGGPDLPRHRLLADFLAQSAEWTAHYNAAVAETACGLKPLQAAAGELPFFAVWRGADGHLFRTGLNLDGARLVAAGRSWALEPGGRPPLDAMRADGLICLAGKALLLVLQARIEPGGLPLALPHQGSLYMPAAFALERRLRAAGLLTAPAHPVLRVRFRFLDRWLGCPTLLRLPEWLGPFFSAPELTADAFAREFPVAKRNAQQDLDALRTPQGRETVLRRLLPEASARAADLETRRRELARDPATRAAAGQLWDELRPLDRERTRTLAEHALRCLHLPGLDYWDSRGALLPWSIALGGEAFYDHLLTAAELTEETP